MSTMVMCQENSTTPAMFQRYPSPPVNPGFSGFGYSYPGNQLPQDYNQFPMTDPSVQQAWYNAMYGGRADEWGYGTPTSSSSPPGMGSYPYRTGTMGIDYSQAGQGMTSQTIDSPGNTSSSSSNSGSPSNKQLRPPYDWMKKAAFQGAPIAGKTRTKDKYRVVYSDHQRLELEKEFHYSRYITIRRKAELAQSLALSERQVKIWFQNRRAKERKQNKKRDEASVMKMGDMSPELAEENKQQIQQHMNLHMNAHAQHQIRLQTPSPSPLHGQPQYQVPTQCQGHSLQTSESPLNTISPSHSVSPNHLFSPQGQLAMSVSPVNAHTSPASCSVTPPITIKTDLDAQDSMTSCV